jgi:hypothetical protein
MVFKSSWLLFTLCIEVHCGSNEGCVCLNNLRNVLHTSLKTSNLPLHLVTVSNNIAMLFANLIDLPTGLFL